MVAAVIFLSLCAHGVYASDKKTSAQSPDKEYKQLAMKFRCYLYQLTKIETGSMFDGSSSFLVAQYKELLHSSTMAPALQNLRAQFTCVGLLSETDGKVSIPGEVKKAFYTFGASNKEFQELGTRSQRLTEDAIQESIKK
jgi:hypothetical protein